MMNLNNSDKNTKHNKSASGSSESSAKRNGKPSSFFRRFMIFLLVSVIGLGGLTGSLLYLDQKGKLDLIREKLSTSRSTSDRKGSYYKDSKHHSDGRDGENDAHALGNTSGAYFLPNDSQKGDLSGYTVILDPGHGGRDTGCCYPFTDPQYNECDFNLRIANEVKEELLDRGATVYMLRTDNSWVSLYNRLAQVHLICLDIAEKEGKLPFSSKRADELREMLQVCIDVNEDTVASGGMGIMVGSGVGEDLLDLFEMEYELDHVLFLSIHLNSSESGQQHGTQLYYVTDDSVIESENRQQNTNSEFQRADFPIRENYYGRHNEDNELLACCIYDNIVGNIPQFDTNGHATNADNYAVLREHGLTGVLIEVAFLTDYDDRMLLLDDSIIETVAASVSDGVEMYFMQKGD